MKADLNDPYIKKLQAQLKPFVVWDNATKCFGVLVNPLGKKSFVVQTRINGKSRRDTIGVFGDIFCKEARKIAVIALHDMKEQTDLLSRLAEKNRQSTNDEHVITGAELVEKFMRDYAEIHCKERSAKEYRISLKNHYNPHFGNHKINKVLKKDLREIHLSLVKTPYAANRMLSAVSKMYNQAIEWELCEGLVNPAYGITKHPEEKRVRYLSQDELRCFLLALNDEEPVAPFAVAAFRIILYSGGRHEEIQKCKWAYLYGNQFILPKSKSGRKSISLNSKAMKVVNAIPRVDGNDYIIVGKKPGSHLVNFKDPFSRVRNRATVYLLRDHSGDALAQLVNDLEKSLGKLPSLKQCREEATKRGLKVPEGLSKFRIHDLRHNLGSQMVMNGEDISVVKSALGHKDIATTDRYVHLSTKTVADAMERTSGAFDVDD
jgi:integrase